MPTIESVDERTRSREWLMKRALANYKKNSKDYYPDGIDNSIERANIDFIVEKTNAYYGVYIGTFFTGSRYVALSLNNEADVVCLFSSKNEKEFNNFVDEERERQMQVIKQARNAPLPQALLSTFFK